MACYLATRRASVLGEEGWAGGGGVEGVGEGVEEPAVGVGFSGLGGYAAAGVGKTVVEFFGGLAEGLQRINPSGGGWFGEERLEEGVSLGQKRRYGEFFSVRDRQELVVKFCDLLEEWVHRGLACAFAVDAEQDALEAGFNDVLLAGEGAKNGIDGLETLGGAFLKKGQAGREGFDTGREAFVGFIVAGGFGCDEAGDGVTDLLHLGLESSETGGGGAEKDESVLEVGVA